MRVKPNSIWFQDTTKLAHWQELKKSRNSAGLASYQDEVLSQRDAWQFVNRLTVKILAYKPGKKQGRCRNEGIRPTRRHHMVAG